MNDTPHASGLAAAFIRMQAELPVIQLDKTVNYKNVKFDYASLSNIISTCRPILVKHGLGIIQHVGSYNDQIEITTVLLHVSGEREEGIFRIKPISLDIKDVGSTITYARRYAYGAMLGIALDGDYDAATVGEIYTGTEEHKTWLRGLFSEIGVTDKPTMFAVSDKLIKERREMKREDVIEILEKMR